MSALRWLSASIVRTARAHQARCSGSERSTSSPGFGSETGRVTPPNPSRHGRIGAVVDRAASPVQVSGVAAGQVDPIQLPRQHVLTCAGGPIGSHFHVMSTPNPLAGDGLPVGLRHPAVGRPATVDAAIGR